MKHVERVAQLSSTSWQGFKERLRSAVGGVFIQYWIMRLMHIHPSQILH